MLPSTIFLSYDFIFWLKQNVQNLVVLEEALMFADRLVAEDRIRYLMPPLDSDNYDMDSCCSFPDKSFATFKFRYGSFLYCVVTDRIEADMAKVDMRGKILASSFLKYSFIGNKTNIKVKLGKLGFSLKIV